MSVNHHLIGNNPIWNVNTLAIAVPAAGAPAVAEVPRTTANGGSASSVTISNTGPVNLYVGTLSVAAILLQPGAAITIGIAPDGAPQVHDTVGTGTWSVVAYE